MRLSTLLILLLLGCLSVSTAHAETPTRTPTSARRDADTLFEQGKARLAAGDYASACPLLTASLQLDPATGTLLALAVCLERSGDQATAVVHYREVLRRSEAEGRLDRAAAARSRIAVLEPTAEPTAAETTPEGTAETTEPTTAPTTSSTSPEPEVPEPEADVVSTEPAPAGVLPERIVEPAPPARPASRAASSMNADDLGPSTLAVVGWSLLGSSAFALGTAAAFTAQALIKNSDSKDGCVVNRCTPTGARDRRDARSAGTAATVSGLVAVLLAAGGVTVLLLDTDTERPSSERASVTPWFDANGVGALATGSF